jgi:hypothetical protein
VFANIDRLYRNDLHANTKRVLDRPCRVTDCLCFCKKRGFEKYIREGYAVLADGLNRALELFESIWLIHAQIPNQLIGTFEPDPDFDPTIPEYARGFFENMVIDVLG